MGEAVTITIPAAPAYALSPNARSHYMVRAKATEHLKHVGTLACTGVDPISGPVTLDWIINLPKGRKHMDWDNAIATLKPAMDSLVSAGVIEDDNTSIVTRIGLTQVSWAKHKVNGGELAVTIRPHAVSCS